VKNSLQCSICISQLWPFLYSPVGDFFLPWLTSVIMVLCKKLIPVI
jgi:hypothetical protein